MSETKYPEYIVKKLRKRLGLDENDTSQDSYIEDYSKSEAFSEVLNWDGLIGWDYSIKEYVKDIYGVDLYELDED
jgi:hypothetical protein